MLTVTTYADCVCSAAGAALAALAADARLSNGDRIVVKYIDATGEYNASSYTVETDEDGEFVILALEV